MLDGEGKAGLQEGSCLLPRHTSRPCWRVFQNLVLSQDILNDWKWHILKGTASSFFSDVCEGLAVNSSLPRTGYQSISPEQGQVLWPPQPLQDSEQHICLLNSVSGRKGVILLFLMISCTSSVPGRACPCLHNASPHSYSAELGRTWNWDTAHIGDGGRPKRVKPGLP